MPEKASLLCMEPEVDWELEVSQTHQALTLLQPLRFCTRNSLFSENFSLALPGFPPGLRSNITSS